MPTTDAPTPMFAAATGRRALTALVALLAFAAVALVPAAGTAEAAKKKQRIAALTPFAVQTLAKLGVKPVVMGESVTGDVGIPKRFRNVPQVPLSHASNGPNQEQLVHYRANVVLSERTWRGGHEALENIGMKVYERDPVKLAQLGRKIKQIGRLVGKKRKAVKLAKSMDRKVRKATRGITSRPETLVLLGVGETPYAFLPNSWGGNLFSRAGANLATSGLSSDGGTGLMISGGFAHVAPDQIVIQSPDVIVAVPHGNADDLDEIKESLENDDVLNDTNAGQNGRIYVTLNNSLLQPDLKAPNVIRMIRRTYLQNW